MREVTKEELFEGMLNIMDEIDRVCEKLNLKYWLLGGSLIGAIRHKGFIPWDDDFDIAMPRADYCKLLRYWNEVTVHKNYVVIEQMYNVGTFRKCKVADNNTIAKEWSGHVRAGIWVDIFPMDGMKSYRFRKIDSAYIRYLMALYAVAEDGNRTSGIRGIVKSLMNCYVKIKGKEKVMQSVKYNLCVKRNMNYTRFLATTTTMHKDITQVTLPNGTYDELVKASFEDREYYIPREYDLVLRTFFGDYMQLPPEDQRHNHGITIYWKD